MDSPLDFPPYSNTPGEVGHRRQDDNTPFDQGDTPSKLEHAASMDPEILSERVSEADRKKIELEQKLRRLAQERDSLKDAQERRQELDQGRKDMSRELTRGIELLDTALFDTKARAEQMELALGSMKSSLARLKAIQTSEWSDAEYQEKLTQALAQLEGSRSEWDETSLKFASILAPKNKGTAPDGVENSSAGAGSWFSGEGISYNELCKVGLALTWPVATAFLMAFIALVILLLQGRAG